MRGDSSLRQRDHIKDIKDKKYPDESSLPLWGVEDTGNAYYAGDMNLIWGLVSPKYKDNINVSTVKQPTLYLPGWLDPLLSDAGPTYGDRHNMPGSDFSVSALSTVYSVGADPSFSTYGTTSRAGNIDYTGLSSLAMWARWQNLTRDSTAASLIPNLIWTDQAASLVVGTKGVLGPGNAAQGSMVITPVKALVRYHIVYAIPAFVCLALLLAITVAAIVCAFVGGGGLRRLRHQLQALSVGRVYTVLLSPEEVNLQMSGREWSKRFGGTKVDLSAAKPAASDTEAAEKAPFVTADPRQGLEDT
ncbi:hypothetical protein LTR49_025906 [Elasticomyces elasticus]|nr:hypothetical protein LTR49_025906 [Elasticomyces elasticus]KAK5739852.1 hypothetical protein LTS12_025123 [Elasticomyces elasticus]